MKVALILTTILFIGFAMGYIVGMDNSPKCFHFANNTGINTYYVDGNLSMIENFSKQIIMCNFEPINYDDALHAKGEGE